MGYSIATPVRSEELKKEMLSFLEDNYVGFEDLVENSYTYCGASPPTDELAYDEGKCRIGFNFNCDLEEWHYISSVQRWISQKVGRRKSRFSKENKKYLYEKPIPYYVYDGRDAIPIDELYRPYKSPFGGVLALSTKKYYAKYNKIIEDEIKRLDNLWESR